MLLISSGLPARVPGPSPVPIMPLLLLCRRVSLLRPERCGLLPEKEVSCLCCVSGVLVYVCLVCVCISVVNVSMVSVSVYLWCVCLCGVCVWTDPVTRERVLLPGAQPSSCSGTRGLTCVHPWCRPMPFSSFLSPGPFYEPPLPEGRGLSFSALPFPCFLR